jgi:hypothetical protein
VDPLDLALDAGHYIDPSEVDKVLATFDFSLFNLEEQITIDVPVLNVDESTYNQYLAGCTEDQADLG